MQLSKHEIDVLMVCALSRIANIDDEDTVTTKQVKRLEYMCPTLSSKNVYEKENHIEDIINILEKYANDKSE